MTETELADRLASMISDLEAHIEQRAQEIAAPLVKAGEERAGRRIAQFLTDASNKLQAKDDLNASLVRMNAALEKRVARWRELAEGRATDMILRWDEVKVGDRIIDGQFEGLEVVDRIEEYDDHWSVCTTDEDGQHWSRSALPFQLVAVRRSKEQADA